MSVRGAWVVAAAFALAGGAASAADIAAGKQKAALCEACHGPEGNSVIPANPSIAGQPAQFITNALYFFKAGSRKDPQMSPIASTLSNADMNDLAAYFSSLKLAPPKHKASAESAAAGPELANKFMCTQCHGPALLGTQHINLNTAYQRPMSDVFDITSSGAWNYNAIASTILKTTSLALADTGIKFADGPDILPRHDAAYWAKATRGFDFSAEDRVPVDLMNEVMWEGVMDGTPYPTRRSGAKLGIVAASEKED